MKIVVTQELGLYEDQIARLKKLGKVKIYKDLAESPEAWLERVKGFDVICSNKFGLKEKYRELRNVLVSVRFVGIGWLDKAVLEQNNIAFANAPGANKDAVSEWIIGMMINLVRQLPQYINMSDEQFQDYDPRQIHSPGLCGLKLCVVGAGNIGKKVGKVCEALDMQVSYFKRGDNLINMTKNADVIVNSLSHNSETEGMLGKDFFNSVKRDSYFVSIAPQEVFDAEAMFEVLDTGKLAGAAIDCAGSRAGSDNPDYRHMHAHPKILATPPIASVSDRTDCLGNDIMIANIEAWANGKPVNLL